MATTVYEREIGVAVVAAKAPYSIYRGISTLFTSDWKVSSYLACKSVKQMTLNLSVDRSTKHME